MTRVMTNVAHTTIAKVATTGIQMAATLVLARTLDAGDYGVVGFASILISFLASVNGLGISPAVIQRAEVDERVLGTAASLNVILSVGAFVVAQLVAPLAAVMLDSPESVNVVRVLAFGFLLMPVGFLSTAILTREMRFAAIRTPQVIGALVTGVTSAAMALAGFKYWSLVFGQFAGSLVGSVLLRRARPVPFKWGIDREEARRLVGFGLPLTAAGLVVFVTFNADNFVVGASLGKTMLGFYAVAFNWATYGCNALNEVVHSVLFPKFSTLQGDVAAMRAAFLRTLRAVTFIAVLGNIGLLVVAEGFLVQVLGKGGPKWIPALSTLEILCVYGVIRSATETLCNPILSLGASRLLFKAGLLAAVVELSLLPFVAKRFGLEGVAVLVGAAYASQLVLYVPFLARRLGVSLSTLIGVLGPIAAAATAAGLFACYVRPEGVAQWSGIFVRLAAFTAAFVVVHEVLSRGSVIAEARQVIGGFSKRHG
jgi:O-antigen/teichoic acid export membrane protein